MYNEAFGEVVFDTGWDTQTDITLWGKTSKVRVTAEAYYEQDKITSAQEQSYIEFKKLKTEKQSLIESLVTQFSDNQFNEYEHYTRFSPTVLFFECDGGYALLFDDKNDPDDGIAVVLYPNEQVLTQDEYL